METNVKECIMLNFQDEVNKRKYKAAEERFYHLSDHLFTKEQLKRMERRKQEIIQHTLDTVKNF
jgi:hypothetical protein